MEGEEREKRKGMKEGKDREGGREMENKGGRALYWGILATAQGIHLIGTSARLVIVKVRYELHAQVGFPS